MRRWAPLLLIMVGLLFVAALAGCGLGGGVGDGGSVSTTQASTETTLPSNETTTTAPSGTTGQTTVTSGSGTNTITVNAYYAKDEKICAAARAIPKTTSVGAAAITSLLQGPTAQEQSGGMSTSIPTGTRLLGLSIKNGIATVDLSREFASGGGTLSMTTRLAQVVFTLTQFPSVKGVNFMLDGKAVKVFGGEGIILDHPVNRSNYEELSPAILIESPTLGQTVTSPVRVRGTANVFEAVLKIAILDQNGKTLVEKRVMASSGTGTRGTFDVTIPFVVGKSVNGTIVAYSNSPKDGSRINVVRIPVELAK